jgi:chemotaxis protein MotB
MAHANKQVEEDEAPGAPEWMVTFSDCMTLLLTFFVLLLSFSSFDERIFKKLQMIFQEELPKVTKLEKRSKDSVISTEQVQITADLQKGSEKPTLNIGLKDKLQKETRVDFRSKKVFSVPSKQIFWGNGALISPKGGQVLAKMASFLEDVPSHVVVSESGPSTRGGDEYLGLSRAWSVVEYLTSGESLDKKWFSISARSTLAQNVIEGDESAGVGVESERTLELVLLRGI